MRGGRILGVIGVLLVGMVHAVTVAPAASATPAWAEVQAQNVSGQDGYFNDVTVAPGGTVWAVGYRVAFLPGATEFRTNVQRFNGSGFEMVSAPDVEGPPATNFLNGVAANAANKVWAVGWARDQQSHVDRTRILRWTGTDWVSVLSPNPGTVRNTLSDVSATGTVAFAVGAAASDFYDEPLALAYDGSTWQTMTTKRPAGCEGHASLKSVYARGATDVWAIGGCESGANPSFVLRFDGISWRVVVKPDALPGVQLNGFASPGQNTLYAVGGDSRGPVVVQIAPKPVTVLDSPESATYWAGGTIGHAGIVMTGSTTVEGTSFAGPSIGRRTDAGWAPRSIGPTFGYFNAITTADDGTVWTVGAQSGKPLVMRRLP